MSHRTRRTCSARWRDRLAAIFLRSERRLLALATLVTQLGKDGRSPAAHLTVRHQLHLFVKAPMAMGHLKGLEPARKALRLTDSAPRHRWLSRSPRRST